MLHPQNLGLSKFIAVLKTNVRKSFLCLKISIKKKTQIHIGTRLKVQDVKLLSYIFKAKSCLHVQYVSEHDLCNPKKCKKLEAEKMLKFIRILTDKSLGDKQQIFQGFPTEQILIHLKSFQILTANKTAAELKKYIYISKKLMS